MTALALRPGQVIALRGRPGSGRTALLLALGGHYRGPLPPESGEIDIVSLHEGEGDVRGSRTALAYVANAHEPEPMLTAGEHIAERVRLLRKPLRRKAEIHRRQAGLPFGAQTLARDLDPLGRHLLMLHVALVSDPDVILIDDIDRGLTPADQEALIDQVRAAGAAAVVTARESED